MANEHVELMEEMGDEAVRLTDLDDCIIGIVEKNGCNSFLYSLKAIIDILKKDMSEEDALEYFNYNIGSLHVNFSDPVFLMDYTG